MMNNYINYSYIVPRALSCYPDVDMYYYTT